MDTATTPKPCQLIGYIRVSTKKQGQSGLGLEAQEAAIAAHVAFSGCVLVKTYQDVESGKRNARPGLALAIAHAKRLRATLVIAKIDRLARNVAFVANLMESKVKFVACDMPQANDMTIHIIAAVAQGEAKAISERTKVALAAAKARGVKLGAPHHLTREGGLKGSRLGAATTKRNAVEHYAYIAPTIAAYRAEGLGYLAIAKRLNAAGEETRNGKAWNAAQVRRVLLEAPPAEQPLPFRAAA
jgi:DNA invertase Pin-like site-specific DNA recombinase